MHFRPGRPKLGRKWRKKIVGRQVLGLLTSRLVIIRLQNNNLTLCDKKHKNTKSRTEWHQWWHWYPSSSWCSLSKQRLVTPLEYLVQNDNTYMDKKNHNLTLNLIQIIFLQEDKQQQTMWLAQNTSASLPRRRPIAFGPTALQTPPLDSGSLSSAQGWAENKTHLRQISLVL